VANPLPIDGTVFDGTTVYGPNASAIEGLPFRELSSVEEMSGRSAWYSVVGTGATLRAVSCVPPNEFDFTVYSGACENLLCVQEVEPDYDESD
jgi:hypothetical protein